MSPNKKTNTKQRKKNETKLLVLKNHKYYKNLNKTSKFSDEVNQRYCRSIKYKSQYLEERHKLQPYLKDNKLNHVCFDKNMLKNLPKCNAKVPALRGQHGRLGEYRQCDRAVLFPGFERCFIHNKMFISDLLKTGVYKEIIKDGKYVCDPNHYVQVLWTTDKGYGLYVRQGQKGDYISFMDGPFRTRRDSQNDYVFHPVFQLPRTYARPPADYIDGLQVPLPGRGVMSFANVSKTPNCERDDQFDKFNCRVWYYLTEDLFPKADGSLHEITITYNNNFTYNKMPPPVPINERKKENIKDGFWPGTQLKNLEPEDTSEDESLDNSEESHGPSLSEEENGEVIQSSTLTEEQEIENKQRACLQIVQSRVKALINNLKQFKDEVIKLCYDNGLFGLEHHLKELVTTAKKKLSIAPMDLT